MPERISLSYHLSQNPTSPYLAVRVTFGKVNKCIWFICMCVCVCSHPCDVVAVLNSNFQCVQFEFKYINPDEFIFKYVSPDDDPV